ncbi:hypothetical protein RJ641_016429 [Dillenia turbinata]|uniref:Uncharacterized protein n=1 Tax=Dillenia turbinata TaxID=194707 RepID=A0AAN8UWC4_9MAGN
MAVNMSCSVSLHSNSFTAARLLTHSNSNSKYKHFLTINCSSSSSPLKATALSEGTEGLNQQDSPAFSEAEMEEYRNYRQLLPFPMKGSLSSTRTQLDLLEQLTSSSPPIEGYESDGSSSKLTIRDQLAQLVGDRDDDFSIQLGPKNLKKVSAKFLTTSQKRNIRRQAYLDEVSQRNDSVFFATIGAFVILPPIVILGIAILTGYVQLFP